MSSEFCQTCGVEVEIMAGDCANGHRNYPVTALDSVRAEVDRAFEDAAVQVAQVLTPPPPPPPGLFFRAPAPAPAAIRPVRETQPVPAPAPILTAPATAGAPGAWSSLPPADPIAQFAPPPRIDWGPERTSGLKRRWRLRAER